MQVSFLPNNLYHPGHLSKRFQDLKETFWRFSIGHFEIFDLLQKWVNQKKACWVGITNPFRHTILYGHGCQLFSRYQINATYKLRAGSMGPKMVKTSATPPGGRLGREMGEEEEEEREDWNGGQRTSPIGVCAGRSRRGAKRRARCTGTPGHTRSATRPGKFICDVICLTGKS